MRKYSLILKLMELELGTGQDGVEDKCCACFLLGPDQNYNKTQNNHH